MSNRLFKSYVTKNSLTTELTVRQLLLDEFQHKKTLTLTIKYLEGHSLLIAANGEDNTLHWLDHLLTPHLVSELPIHSDEKESP